MFGEELREKTIDAITDMYLIGDYLEFGTLNHLSLIFWYVSVILESECIFIPPLFLFFWRLLRLVRCFNLLLIFWQENIINDIMNWSIITHVSHVSCVELGINDKRSDHLIPSQQVLSHHDDVRIIFIDQSPDDFIKVVYKLVLHLVHSPFAILIVCILDFNLEFLEALHKCKTKEHAYIKEQIVQATKCVLIPLSFILCKQSFRTLTERLHQEVDDLSVHCGVSE